MEHNGAHDNTNIRVSNSFNGNIVIVGGVYVGGLGAIFLGLFFLNYWAQAIVLSAVIIWGLVAILGLAVITGGVIIWVRFIIQPLRSKILHTDPNYSLVLNGLGNVEMLPVGGKSTVVEADATMEMHVVDLANHGMTQKMIADGMHISQPTVSRIISKHKAEKP